MVEDEAATLRFYLAGLRGMQEFRLLAAENGAEALAVLQSNPVDVVVTDLKMPVLDGYALLAILAERYPSLPVIVLTAVAEPGMLVRAERLGALRILAKPIKLSLLMEEIRAAASSRAWPFPACSSSSAGNARPPPSPCASRRRWATCT